MSDETRKGPGYRWRASLGHLIAEGHTVDNLNTKTMEEAVGIFEKIFIEVRGVLLANDGCCLDVEEERLQVCHAISRRLSQNFKTYGKE